MIDLHILNHAASTRPEWWVACLESAKAAEATGRVTLHVIESTDDNIGASRAAAYRLGSNPLVACLDNDDLINPEALPALLAALAEHPEVCGVYSDKRQIDAEGHSLFIQYRRPWHPEQPLTTQDFPHHLAVYRREAVMPHLQAMALFKNYSEFVLAGLATQFGPWWHVPVIAYQRREKEYYVNHVRPIDPETTARARALVLPPLLNRLHQGR
ncbi:MAG: glycosyltransferase [Candidatus Competibacteraceae bacterium]|nr:glycosyltransferase [Candidatus Competibacteraceae bacterium]